MLDRLPQFMEVAKEKKVDINLSERLCDDEEECKTDRGLISDFLE